MGRIRKTTLFSLKLTWNTKCILAMMISLIGTTIFYIIPYIRVLYYSTINNQFQRRFVGLKNYWETLNNSYFRLSFNNSILIILICVPILVMIAIVVSILLSYYMKNNRLFRFAYIFPSFLPTASVVLIWKHFFQSFTSVFPIYAMFIWKNTGLSVLLITAAIYTIPKDIYEAASMDGVNNIKLHRYITIPMIFPTVLFTVLLSIVNTFRIYKESYLYYSDNYPPEHSYSLQYYMNNNFMKLDYQALSTSAILTSLLVLLIVVFGIRLQRRYER